MILALAAIVLIAWLPGAVLFRLPTADRAHRATLRFDERAYWTVLISVTWSVSLAMALAGLGLYTLTRTLWINAAVSAGVVLIYRRRLRYSVGARRPDWSLFLPASLLALGIWLYFPAADYLMGGKDPGVYVNHGVQIAKHGTLVVRDPLIAEIPAESRPLFFRPITETEPYSVRFMGFFVRDAADGRVIPQFPGWMATSIAIGYDIAGLDGARATTGVWALLGLLAVYFAGARLFGVLAGAAGTALVAIHVLEVWFARYPNAELASQAMLFAALVAFRYSLDGSRQFFGTIAGLFAGLQLFARFDGLLTVGALAGAAVLGAVRRQWPGRPFAVALTISTVAGLWYLVGPMWHYSATYLGTVHYGGGWWLLGALAAAAVTFVVLVRREPINAVVRATLPVAVAVLLIALAVYAGFFREPTDPTAFGAVGNAYALRNFAWYLTEPGLVLAVAAFAVLVWRRWWDDPAFFLTVAIYAVLTFYKPRIVPEHFWAGRRFLSVILPAALLTLPGLAAWSYAAAPQRPRWLRPTILALAIGVLAALGVSFWQRAAPVRGHVEYAGLQQEIERRLVTAVGPRDLVLVESRRADSDLHVLALPLAYVYDRNVLVLDAWNPNKRALEAFVTWARSRFANVYFLGGGGTDLLSRDIDGELVAASRIRVPEYASTLNAYPQGVRTKEFDVGLYRLVPPHPSGSAPVDLFVGGQDDLNVARFFAKERRADGSTFRWTKNRSFVMLRGIGPGARELVIWMSSGGRPPQAPSPAVTVFAADRAIGHALPVNDERPYVFPLPPDLVAAAAASGDPLQVRLDVVAWNPNRVLQLPDTRDLGVLVTRVQIR